MARSIDNRPLRWDAEHRRISTDVDSDSLIIGSPGLLIPGA